MRQLLLVSLCTLALALSANACGAGTADDEGGSGICSSDEGCSSGYGCSVSGHGSQNVCESDGGAWKSLLTEQECLDAGKVWGPLVSETDCVEAGFQWNEGAGGSGQVCAPNIQITCPCGGGLPAGIQSCNAEGIGWSACDCGGDSCTPDCGDRVCGDDGCGDACGACAGDEVCNGGVCEVSTLIGHPCETNGEEACDGVSTKITCSGGTWLAQPCGPSATCVDGVCEAGCEATCVGDCGDDGCGGSCGTCPGGESCVSGTCQQGCTPSCGGKSCGDDGCGGSCGTCPSGESCSSLGTCFSDTQCTPHAKKRCDGDTINWYDSCDVLEGPLELCEDWEYCKHSGQTDAKCLKGLYAGQWMVKAVPSDPMFFDNVMTLTEDEDANTVTFEENIPGSGTAYYTGELDGKLLIAEGSYDSGGVTYNITVQVTFSVPPDTAGVAPTEFTGFWSTDPQFEGMSLGAIVNSIVGDKQ